MGEGKKAWVRVGRVLLDMGVLTGADLHALEAYCTVYARWKDAEAHLQQNGVMLSNAGKLFPSPYLKIAEDNSKAMRAWMTEFGITPSSRSRVSVERKKSAIPDNEDWFNEHLN
jgi:P27 family predicted phage terminase small subunit